jgi:hypothetical protein
MTLDEFRLEMDSYWRSVDEEARSLKDPHIALERLLALYRKFDAGERQMADQVLNEWALEKSEGRRSYALALIGDLKIVTAMPALQELAQRFAASSAPGAADEREIVERVIAELKE